MPSIFKKGWNQLRGFYGVGPNNRPPPVGQEWNAAHQIDPNTGEISGPPGAVPQEVGLDVQARHEMGVWNRRNALGASASHWAQGALGLLQSYRPGGGAALESGIYGQLAGIDLQRAQMLQPLDLLGGYREEQARKARRATEKAGYVSAIGSLAGGLLGAAMGGGPSIGLALTKNQGGQVQGGPGPGEQPGYGENAGGFPTNFGQPPSGSGQAGQPGYAGQAMLNPGFGQAMGQLPPGGAGQTIYGGGSSGGGGAAGSWGGPAGGPGGGPAGVQSGGPGGAAPPGQGGGEQRRGGAPGGQPGGSGGSVGANGDFTPMTWAARAAGSGGPVEQIQQVHLSSYVAHLIEDDPAWEALDYQFQREIAMRGVA